MPRHAGYVPCLKEDISKIRAYDRDAAIPDVPITDYYIFYQPQDDKSILVENSSGVNFYLDI
jgi:hypothetical protein